MNRISIRYLELQLLIFGAIARGSSSIYYVRHLDGDGQILCVSVNVCACHLNSNLFTLNLNFAGQLGERQLGSERRSRETYGLEMV